MPRPRSGRRRGTPHCLAKLGFLTSVALLLSEAAGQLNNSIFPLEPEPLPLPQLDYTDLQSLAFLGDFNSGQLLSYEGQENFTLTSSSARAADASGNNPLVYAELGASLGFSNSSSDTPFFSYIPSISSLQGSVDSMCVFPDSDGSSRDPLVYMGGSFTLETDSLRAENFTALNTSSGEFIDLITHGRNSTLAGHVHVVHCNPDDGHVYLGGDFVFNGTHGAALYNTTARELQNLPFLGFGAGSEVRAITAFRPDPHGPANVLFGGSFDTLGNSSLLELPSGTGNGTVNATANATVQNEPQVNFNLANTWAEGTTSQFTQFSDPRAPLCPSADSTASTWLLDPGRGGAWSAELPSEVHPTKLRLYNVDGEAVASDTGEEYGTKTFRLISFPSNGIMNLTYTDPKTGEQQFCDAWCPLYPRSDLKEAASGVSEAQQRRAGWTTEYQEFTQVNVIPATGFQLLLLDYYGAGAGLAGIEVAQAEQSVFANQTLNAEPVCNRSTSSAASSSASVPVASASAAPLAWQQAELLSGATAAYITAEVPATNGVPTEDAWVDFYPAVAGPGNYSFVLWTPGCAADGTCDTRGIASVSVVTGDEATDVTRTVYQTNMYEKYDVLFSGYLRGNGTASGSGSRNGTAPYIRMKLTAAVNSAADAITFVAERVVATYSGASEPPTQVALNGVFEYAPANFSSVAQPVANTSVNALGSLLSSNASVAAIAVSSDQHTVLVAGDFRAGKLGAHAVALQRDSRANSSTSAYRPVSVDSAGLNGPVRGVVPAQNGSVLLYGDFTATASNGTANSSSSSGGSTELRHVAQCSFATRRLTPLAGGLSAAPAFGFSLGESGDGAVFVADGGVLFPNGTSTVAEFGNTVAWNISGEEWLNATVVNSSIRAVAQLSGNATLLSGSVQIGSHAATAGILTSYEAAQLVSGANSLHFSDGDNVVTVGVQLNDSVSVYGGQFVGSVVGNGSELPVENLFVTRDGQAEPVTGISWNGSASVDALLSYKQWLFVGGAFEAQLGDSLDTSANASVPGVSCLAFYDLSAAAFATSQPPPVSGSSHPQGGPSVVKTMAVRQSTNTLVVGGSFGTVGSLSCPAFCLYDLENLRWTRPESSASSISGTVNRIGFVNDREMVLAGELWINDTATAFAMYDFETYEFSVLEEWASGTNGEVRSFAVATGDSGNGQSNGDWVFAAGVAGTSGTDNSVSSSASELTRRQDVVSDTANGTFVSLIHGGEWTSLMSGLDSSSDVQSVQLLPRASTEQSASAPFDEFVLLVTGRLAVGSASAPQNCSAAFYDGTQWTPYLTTARLTDDGAEPGTVYFVATKLSESVTPVSSNHRSVMKTGFVVLVSLAIAVLIMLVLVGIFVLIGWWRRRSSGYRAMPNRISEQEMAETVPPANLLEEIEIMRARKEKV